MTRRVGNSDGPPGSFRSQFWAHHNWSSTPPTSPPLGHTKAKARERERQAENEAEIAERSSKSSRMRALADELRLLYPDPADNFRIVGDPRWGRTWMEHLQHERSEGIKAGWQRHLPGARDNDDE